MKQIGQSLKRSALAAVAVLLAVAASAGIAWAVFFSTSETTQNSLSAGVVKCQVEEEFDGVTKDSITVKNTGTVTSYVRVRLVTYWANEDDAPVGKPMPKLTVSVSEGWTQSKDGCFYAKRAVAPGESTTNLLAEPIILASSGTYRQVVEVLAETIQSQPDEAVAEVWGVEVSGGVLASFE